MCAKTIGLNSWTDLKFELNWTFVLIEKNENKQNVNYLFIKF